MYRSVGLVEHLTTTCTSVLDLATRLPATHVWQIVTATPFEHRPRLLDRAEGPRHAPTVRHARVAAALRDAISCPLHAPHDVLRQHLTPAVGGEQPDSRADGWLHANYSHCSHHCGYARARCGKRLGRTWVQCCRLLTAAVTPGMQ